MTKDIKIVIGHLQVFDYRDKKQKYSLMQKLASRSRTLSKTIVFFRGLVFGIEILAMNLKNISIETQGFKAHFSLQNTVLDLSFISLSFLLEEDKNFFMWAWRIGFILN